SDAVLIVREAFKHNSLSSVVHELRRGRRRLQHCAIGSEVATKQRNSPEGSDRSIERPDDVVIKAFGMGVIFLNCKAIGIDEVGRQGGSSTAYEKCCRYLCDTRN